MQFTNKTNRPILYEHLGRAAGMQRRMVDRCKTQRLWCEQGFQVGFDIEIINVSRRLPPLLLGYRTVRERGDTLGLIETGNA